MPKTAEVKQTEQSVREQFGQCSACLEMTTVDDPCCPMAGVLIDGIYICRCGEGDAQ